MFQKNMIIDSKPKCMFISIHQFNSTSLLTISRKEDIIDLIKMRFFILKDKNLPMYSIVKKFG
jgi:hypothetical protein